VLNVLRRGNKSKFINHKGGTPPRTAQVTSVYVADHITIREVCGLAKNWFSIMATNDMTLDRIRVSIE
jgi:hypothetical protein